MVYLLAFSAFVRLDKRLCAIKPKMWGKSFPSSNLARNAQSPFVRTKKFDLLFRIRKTRFTEKDILSEVYRAFYFFCSTTLTGTGWVWSDITFLHCPRVLSSALLINLAATSMKNWERLTKTRTRGRRVRGANATSVLCPPSSGILLCLCCSWHYFHQILSWWLTMRVYINSNIIIRLIMNLIETGYFRQSWVCIKQFYLVLI